LANETRTRARLYVEDGQGAIELQIAHQKRALESATGPNDAAELRQMIEVWNEWLATQRMEAYVEVSLGSWSGLNIRKMAEEVGFIDSYNYVYQPFSSVVHSNMGTCEHVQYGPLPKSGSPMASYCGDRSSVG